MREYAETFPVVGGDFSYYQFPAPDYWARLFDGSPPTLGFGLKVPEEITVKTWPAHARYGPRGGQANEHFLDASLFQRALATPLEPHRQRVAVLMLEFSTFAKQDFRSAAEQLRNEDVGLRVFLLLRPPFMNEAMGLEWACRSLDRRPSHPRAHHWVEVVETDEQELLIIRKRVAPALAAQFNVT